MKPIFKLIFGTVYRKNANFLCYEPTDITSKFARCINKHSLHNNVQDLEIRTNSKMTRNLAAFDFDHTIVDDNTDIVVRDLIPKDSIPVSVKKLYKNDGWTAYMQGVFELLHANGHNEPEINSTVCKIPATKGMPELLKKLTQELNYDVIIISDSNSYLIKTWLEGNGLQECVEEVFTNPARFEKGVLRVDMYHLQTECKLSTKNLCKGMILEDYLNEKRGKGVEYERIVYVGDGTNDFCPILRLGEKDLACVRENYSCVDLIKKVKDGKTVPSTGKTYEVKAEVLVWNSGLEILDAIKK